MEVILKQDIINLGSKDDIVKVRNGYANNYLIPNGYAIVANASSRKMHAEIVKQRAHKEAKLREEAQQIAEKLKDIKISIGAKTQALRGTDKNIIWLTADESKVPALIKFSIPVGTGQLTLTNASGL